jgi:DNA repair exonuclease SbcCD ATPase subunit
LTLGLGISAAALVLILFALLKKPSGHREQQVLVRKIRHFLASFPLEPADPEKQLSQLRQLYPVFRAEEEKRSYRASLSAQVQQLSHQLPENLSQLEEDSAAYETALHQWELCRGQLAQAQRQGDPDLQSKLTRLQTSIDDLRRRQFSLENQAACLTQLEDQLAEARNTLQEHRKHCDLLDLAIQLLERAREDLSQSYLDPVQQHFDRYARQLLSLAEASLDEELNPTIGRHALGYFSPGYADGIRLCMHLALTDSLFPGEKPPLILDDPFVNLDEENLCRAKEILNTLSQSRQILHLTCHESRA